MQPGKSTKLIQTPISAMAVLIIGTACVVAQVPHTGPGRLSLTLIATFDDVWVAAREAPSVKGALLTSTGPKFKEIYLRDDADGGFVQLLTGNKESELSPSTIRVSRDNRVVAANDNNRYVRVWQVKSGRLTQLIPVPFKSNDPIFKTVGVLKIALSPDGRLVATGRFSEKHVTVWDTASGRPKFSLTNPYGEDIASLEFSPDGETLATAFYNRIILWEVETGKLQMQLKAWDDKTEQYAHSKIYELKFSPDGTLLATSNTNGKARLWDVDQGEMKFTFEHKNKRAEVVEFSLDGQLLATGSNDKTVRIWDVKTGKLLRALRHRKSVIGIDFSSPEHGLLRVVDDQWSSRGVYLWHIASGELIEKGQNVGTFSRDGKRMIRWISELNKAGLFEIVAY